MKPTVEGVWRPMEGGTPRIPAEVEAAIKAIVAESNTAEAAFLLASIANRATAALHQLARGQANAHKGQPDWGRWASLTNVSRDAVLRTATCRQAANQLVVASHATSESADADP